MNLNTLLLLGAIWILWTIYVNSKENLERQHHIQSLLEKLQDNQQQSDGEAGPAKPAEFINLNTANKALLQSLPRIGAISAEHIIDARPFTSLEQLREVSGITHSVFKEIKKHVSL